MAGATPAGPEQHKQERELFNFFTQGLATIESFCYGLYAIGSMMDPKSFPMTSFEERKRVTPEKTTKRFDACFPADCMTMALEKLLADPEYEKWKGLRNILTHRVSLARHTSLFVGSRTEQGGTTWKDVDLKSGPEDMDFNLNTTALRRKWLVKTVNELMTQADGFTSRHELRLPAECR